MSTRPDRGMRKGVGIRIHTSATHTLELKNVRRVE
jgi:hypothetical protein